MTQLPNIITLLRIAGSMGLLFCDVMITTRCRAARPFFVMI